MITLGEALLYFRGDDSDLKRKMSDVESDSQGFAGRVSGFLQGAFQFAAGSLIADGISAIGSAIIGTGKDALESYAYFERLGSSLGQLSAAELVNAGNFSNINDAMETGNAIAQNTIKWVETLAAKSPFDLKSAAQALQTAEAYGFVASSYQSVAEAQEKGVITAQRVTQAAVDAAAANGKDGDAVARITRELGQMQAMQKVTLGGLNSLTMAGVQARKYLADAFTGGNIPELMQKIASGAIDANEAVMVLTKGIEKDMGGAAEKQANTFSGLLSTLSDLADFAKRDLFGGIFKAAQPYLVEFVNTLGSDTIRQGLRDLGNLIGTYVAGGLKILADGAAFLAAQWDRLAPIIATVTDALGIVTDVMNQLASLAFGWGADVAGLFGDGIASMVQSIVDSLSVIGDTVAYWLQPNSPPKLLPNIDKWGADAMSIYMNGFGEADFGVFDKLSSDLEGALKGMVDAGQMSESSSIEHLLGGRAAFAAAIDELNRTGTVAESTFANIKEQAGSAGDQIVAVTKNYLALNKAQKDLTKAQEAQKDLDIELLVAQADLLVAQQSGNGALAAERNSHLKALKDRRTAARENEKKAAEEKARVEASIKQQELQMKFQQEQNALLKKQVDIMEKMRADAKKDKGKDKEATALARAQEAYNMSLMTTVERIEYLKNKLASMNPQQAEYWSTLGQIKSLEDTRDRDLERAADKQLQWDLDHTSNLNDQLDMLKKQQSQFQEGSDEWKKYQGQIEQVQKKQEQDAKRREEAEFNYKYAIASNEERLAMLKDKLSKQTEGSEDYYQTLTKIDSLEDSMAKKAKAAGGAGGKKKPISAGPKLPPIVLPENNQATLAGQAKQVVGGAMDKAKAVFRLKLRDLPKMLLDIIPQFLNVGLQAIPGLLTLGGKIVVALLDGAGKYLPKLWDWETQLFGRLVDTATKALPGIMEVGTQVVLSILDGIVRNTPLVLRGIATAIMGQIDVLLKNLPVWVEELGKFGAALVDWVIEAAPGLLDQLLALIGDIVDWGFKQLPVLTGMLGKWTLEFIKWVGPAAGKLILALGKLVGQIFTFLNNKLPGWKAQWDKFSLAAGQWILNDLFPALLNGLGGLATTLWEGIKPLWDNAWAEGSIGGSIISSITDPINSWAQGIADWWSGGVTEPFTASVASTGTEVGNSWGGFWAGIQTKFDETVQSIKDGFNQWLDDLLTSMGLDPEEMRKRWAAIWADIELIATTISTRVNDWIARKVEELRKSVSDKMSELKKEWDDYWDGVFKKGKEIWDAVSKAVSEWVTKEVVKPIVDEITRLSKEWDRIWTAIKKIAADIWADINREIVQPLNDLYRKVTSKIDDIKNWMGQQKDRFVQYGKDFVQGIIDGVGEMAGALADAATKLVEKMIQKAKDALNINSPSRRSRDEIAKPFGEGIVAGILGQERAVTDATNVLTDAMFGGGTTGAITIGTAIDSTLDRVEKLLTIANALEEKPTILITGNTLQGPEDLDTLAEQLASRIARRRTRG